MKIPCISSHQILFYNIKELTFTVALDDENILMKADNAFDTVEEDSYSMARRSYLTSSIKTRVHQRSFRERVLRAYNGQCALCQLRHFELLDGENVVCNGYFPWKRKRKRTRTFNGERKLSTEMELKRPEY